MRFASVVCSVIGVAFAAESVGLFVHSLNVAAAAVLLLVGAALDPTTRSGDAPTRWGALGAGSLLALVGLVCLPLPMPVRPFAVGLWFVGMDVIGRARTGRVGPAAALAVGCVLLGVVRYASHASLLAWYASSHGTHALSGQIAALTGRPLLLGPTFSGLDLVVLALGVCLGGLRLPGARPVLRLVLAVIAIGVLSLGSLCLLAWTPELTSLLERGLPTLWAQRVAGWVALLDPVHMALLLALPLAAVVAAALTAAPLAAAPARRPPRAAAWMVVPAALLAVASLTNLPGSLASEPRRVALYEKGFINWLVPTHERYGSRSGGMFGNLPQLVRHLGWESAFIDRIDSGTLADHDVLVIINQFEPFDEASREAIDGFLRGGGALLVLGDHTFYKGPDGVPPDQPIEGERLQINQPIRTSHIAFRFDSAYYFIGGWLHSFGYAPHWIVAGLGDASNEPGCVVGASLDLAYPAAPLVVGRYGYADAGVHPSDPTAAARGYMDNSFYDPGEELGDLVLVAAENVGEGKLVVIGDTSGLVNSIQVQTWPFVVRLFHWLGSDGRAAIPAWRDVLGLLLLALVAALVLQGGRATLVTGAASLLVGGLASLHAVTSWVEPPPLDGRVAVVDLSHVGKHSIEGWRDRGVSGLYLNLMRAGYHTLGAKTLDADQLLASELFVSVAPTAAYDEVELDLLWEFMEGGGRVLLAVGFEDRAGSRSLLERAGLTIPHRPLGREPARVPGASVTPSFFEAWPVLGGDRTLVTVRDEPVVVTREVGQGRLVVIGDTDFLLNRNLEVEDGAILANVQFLSWLLAEVAAGGAP